MSKIDRWIDNRAIQNVFIWVCLFVILLGTIQAENKLVAAIFAMALLAPSIYINNFFILPYFKRKPIIFAALFVLNVLIWTAIAVYFISDTLAQGFEWKMFVNFSGVMFLSVFFGAAIKIARDSFERRQQEKEAELKLLKAQLNPHFLFNTLNNLYGLSVIKSDKLPDLMLKLSDLLRYSLYDTKELFVPLEKEIQYLENYISLERIRLEDQTNIQFNCKGKMEACSIAPMLLIVFVENAFKHLGTNKSNISKVLVDLHVDDEKLIFKCVNSIDEVSLKEKDLEKGKSGIGLQNAKKRLGLIYPEKHQLKIEQTKENYSIELTLLF